MQLQPYGNATYSRSKTCTTADGCLNTKAGRGPQDTGCCTPLVPLRATADFPYYCTGNATSRTRYPGTWQPKLEFRRVSRYHNPWRPRDIASLRAHTTAGLDHIPARLLWFLVPCSTEELASIFAGIVTGADIPDHWREVRVALILK